MNFCDWVLPGLDCVGGFRRLGLLHPAMNFCDWVLPGLGCVGGLRRLGVAAPAMNLVWLVLAQGLSGFVEDCDWFVWIFSDLQAWRRPTLPRLETKYHWR